MEPFHDQPRKRHAQLRHQPRSAPLWVGDADDWALVRREPRPPLVCPEPGCDVELISYENLNNKHNPRIFKFKPAGRSCDHWTDRGPGGGPETAQHEWMKSRLTSIARQLGYTATPEHVPTRADVFVHEPAFCLEVQLVATQFGGRTAARQARGTKVCWLIREGLDTPKVLRALFQLPAVRFRVIDQHNARGRLLTPWDHPGDRDLAHRARLQVFGTVAYAPRADKQASFTAPGAGWFRTGTMDGYQFLQQVLSGRRTWYPPRTLGHKSGLWALDTEVADYQAFCNRQHDLAVRRSRLLQDELAEPASPAGNVPLPSASPASRSQPSRPRPEVPQPVQTIYPPDGGMPSSTRDHGPDLVSPVAAAATPAARLRAWWQWRLRRRR